MTRLVFFCAIVLVSLWSVSSSQISIKDIQVAVKKNSTGNGEVTEEVTFKFKPKTKQAIPSGIVEVTFGKDNPFKKQKPKGRRVGPTKRKRHHLRRRCCEVGDLAGKNGFSCSISRNWSRFFLNQTTRMRMKYSSTKGDKGSIRSRVRSKREFHIYRRINKCVKQQMKSAVQKCCLAYVAQKRGWKQG